MLYKGTIDIAIETTVWVEADTEAEARAKLEAMGPDDLKKHMNLHNLLDLFEIENPEDILYKVLE